MKRIQAGLLIIASLFGIFAAPYADALPVIGSDTNLPEQSAIVEQTAAPTPTEETTPLYGLQIVSHAVMLMDADTGQILAERNMNEKMYPASVTKLMTALVALENGNLKDVVTVGQNTINDMNKDPTASRIGLKLGEKITLEQLMYGMLLISGNDAAYAIAEHVGGSEKKFVEMMNKRAAELGCKNTHFNNVHGMPDKNHYTSAYDLALIMRACIKTEKFMEIESHLTYTIPTTNKFTKERVLQQSHGLMKTGDAAVYSYKGAIAGKTGLTTAAGHTLVTAVKRGNRTLVAVVLKSQKTASKYYDTITLLDYGFDKFSEVTLKGGSFAPVYVPFDIPRDSGIIEITAAFSGEHRVWLHNVVSTGNIQLKPVLSGSISEGATIPLEVSIAGLNVQYKSLGTVTGVIHILTQSAEYVPSLPDTSVPPKTENTPSNTAPGAQLDPASGSDIPSGTPQAGQNTGTDKGGAFSIPEFIDEHPTAVLGGSGVVLAGLLTALALQYKKGK